jgi:hypothetical protein
MQDEISSANPSLQLLEQHGLGGLIPGGRNAAAPPQPQPAAAGNKGAKEPSPRANPVVNRRKPAPKNFHARRQVSLRFFFSPLLILQAFLGFLREIGRSYDQLGCDEVEFVETVVELIF